MHKLVPLVVFGAAAAWAGVPSNSVIIHERSGAPQINRPVTVHRVFARGEIGPCAQARIAGGVALTTQTNVQTRWKEPVAAVTGATNATPIQITTSKPHGLTTGDVAGAYGVQGNTAANGEWVVTVVDSTHFTIPVAGNGAYTVGGFVETATGSVASALVSFVIPSLPASGSVAVEFVSSATCNTSGSLTQDQMLSGTYNFGAQIAITNSVPATYYANARTMLAAGAWRYRAGGSIMTEIIIEDRTTARAYDLGWETQNLNGVHFTKSSFHPIFVARFYNGYPNVEVDVIGENAWADTLQDLNYSLDLKGGNPLGAAQYTHATFTHYARTRWRKKIWSGTPLGAILIDPNLAYLVYSKAVPPYRQIPLSQEGIDLGVAQLTGSDLADGTDPNDIGRVEQGMGSTGGRPDIGLHTGWAARYLHAASNQSLYDMMLRTGEVSGHISVHYRDSGLLYGDAAPRTCAANSFCYLPTEIRNDTSVDAIGRPHSIGARTGIRTMEGYMTGAQSYVVLGCNTTDPNREAGCAQNDAMAASASLPSSVSAAHGWSWDTPHHPDLNYVPWLVTGDWFFVEELQFTAGYIMGAGEPNCGGQYCETISRFGEWGSLHYQTMRGNSWGQRTLLYAAFATPDGTPEKRYFTYLVNANIAVREGMYDVRGGMFGSPDYSCPGFSLSSTDKWCKGRKVAAGSRDLSIVRTWRSHYQTLDTETRTISNIANTTPVRITLNSVPHKNHWTGAQMKITGTPFAALNDRIWVITRVSSTEYDLNGSAAQGAGSGGTATLSAEGGSGGTQGVEVGLADGPGTSAQYVEPPWPAYWQTILQHRAVDLGFHAEALAADYSRLVIGWLAHPDAKPYTTAAYKVPAERMALLIESADPATDTIAITGHGLADGTAVAVRTQFGTLPGGLAAATSYYVRDATADTFKVAAYYGGPALNIASAGSGAIYVTLTPRTWSQFMSVLNGWFADGGGQTTFEFYLADPTHGYSHMIQAAAAMTYRETAWGLTGKAAWDWVYAAAAAGTTDSMNDGACHGLNCYPNWALWPWREAVKPRVQSIGDTFAVVDYVTPRADEACTVGGVSDGITTTRYRTKVFTGLTAGTAYTKTIGCASDPYGAASVSFTTAATLSGTGTLSVRVGSGSTTVYLDHGPTEALGATESASCASGCTITATVNKGIRYYRVRRDTGETGDIGTTAVRQ